MAVQEPGRPVQERYAYAGSIPFSRILMFVACVLFVLAAFAAGGGHPLAGIAAWSWGFGAFAAVALSWAVP
jgi:hypothetical protein